MGNAGVFVVWIAILFVVALFDLLTFICNCVMRLMVLIATFSLNYRCVLLDIVAGYLFVTL